PDRMMVVAGKERLARRRAKGGRVKLRVPEPAFRERIQRGHLDAAAERARRAEADIVEQNYDHVGRTFRRPEWLDRWKLCVARVQWDLSGILVLSIRYRQLSAIDLLRGRRNYGR